MKATDLQIKGIIDKIAREYNPLKIWLFGSYVKNKQHDFSDIDLLIIKDTDTKLSKRPAEIHRLFHPYVFDPDVIVYTSEEFENQKKRINSIAFFINREGKLVYERSI